MSTATKKSAASDSYLDLVKKFPLRPIRSSAEYDRAVKFMDGLAIRDENTLDDGETDYLGALATLVESYDAIHHAIDTSKTTPLSSLKFLMEQHDMTVADLGRLLGNSGLASQILNRKRELSKANIQKLASRFGVSVAVFF